MNSARLHDEVADAVPLGADAAASYAEIHAVVDCWSPITIRHAIRELIAAGRVKRAEGTRGARFYRPSP